MLRTSVSLPYAYIQMPYDFFASKSSAYAPYHPVTCICELYDLVLADSRIHTTHSLSPSCFHPHVLPRSLDSAACPCFHVSDWASRSIFRVAGSVSSYRINSLLSTSSLLLFRKYFMYPYGKHLDQVPFAPPTFPMFRPDRDISATLRKGT